MKKLKYKYIAIDFDGTIVGDDYPDIKELKPYVKRVINKIKEIGGEIIIWTCRCGKQLDECIKFLEANNIPYDAINENHKDLKRKFNNDTRKIGADIYIDDKAKNIFS